MHCGKRMRQAERVNDMQESYNDIRIENETRGISGKWRR